MKTTMKLAVLAALGLFAWTSDAEAQTEHFPYRLSGQQILGSLARDAYHEAAIARRAGQTGLADQWQQRGLAAETVANSLPPNASGHDTVRSIQLSAQQNWHIAQASNDAAQMANAEALVNWSNVLTQRYLHSIRTGAVFEMGLLGPRAANFAPPTVQAPVPPRPHDGQMTLHPFWRGPGPGNAAFTEWVNSGVALAERIARGETDVQVRDGRMIVEGHHAPIISDRAVELNRQMHERMRENFRQSFR